MSESDRLRRELKKGLAAAGKALVDRVLDEMESNACLPDAREYEAIAAAARLRDREFELSTIIAADGMVLTAPSGRKMTHPALVEQRQAAAALVRILSSVSLTDSYEVVSKSARHVRAGNAFAAKHHG